MMASVPVTSWRWRWAALALLTLGACGGGEAKAPNPTRPLDERRALEIIARAVRDKGETPMQGRPIVIAEEKTIDLDVAVQGKKHGMAYLTASEKAALGTALPARDPNQGDVLQLVRGSGDEADTRVLVLHDSDYLYDDQVGSGHEDTTITAELKLARDVKDFLVRARTEGWP